MKSPYRGFWALCLAPFLFFTTYIRAESPYSWGDTFTSSHDTNALPRPVNVDDMIRLHDLGGMVGEGLGVSPDGNYVAFQSHQANLDRNSYEVAWFVLSLTEQGEPVYLGDAGEPLLFRSKTGSRINGAWQSTKPVWSPDSQWVAYRRMDGDLVQIWRSSVDGSIQEQLTHNGASVDKFRWADDGAKVFFETDAPLVQRKAHLAKKAENGFWMGDDHFYPRTMRYPFQKYELTGGKPILWVLDVASKQERLASEEEIKRHFETDTVSPDLNFGGIRRASQIPGRPLSRDVTISVDGKNVAWLEAEVEAVYPILQVRARLGGFEAPDVHCRHEVCFGRISQLWWGRDNGEVIFLRLEGANKGRQLIYGWDPIKNTLRKIHEDNNQYLSACSSTGDSLVCFSDGPEKPRVLVSLELKSGLLKELFNPNPQFEHVLVGTTERLEWSNEYGMETWAYVVKPLDYIAGRRYPLVIVQYLARACFKGGTGDEYPAHLFAAVGFVVLCFDEPRLYEMYKSMKLMEAQQLVWKDYYEQRVVLASLDAAIDLLDEKGLIDPTRVGITGLSSGADTISYALSHSKRFSAAISSGGAWEPCTYYFSPGWIRSFNSDRGFGRPGSANDKYWSGMSLSANVENVNTPLLTLTSDDEALYKMPEYVTLRELGKPVDVYVFPDEYHIKWHPRNRKGVAVRAVDWMRFWLQGEQDPDPAKAPQYEHWQRLREQQAASENSESAQ